MIAFPRATPAAAPVAHEDIAAPRGRRERSAFATSAALAGLWILVVTASAVFKVEHPALRHTALFVHLLSFTVGFGAVVVMDVYGLLWLLGRRSAAEVVRLTVPAHSLICLGVGGLLTSGVALHPDLTSPFARVKLVLVLVVMLNGLNAHRFTRRLAATPGDTRGENIPWSVVPRALTTGLLSQVAWWGAMIIGFLTTSARSG